MTDPRQLSILDFTYELPDDRIARYPLPERDASKLLVYREGHISDDCYRNISAHIPENSLLVFNNTRVVEARLLFQKPTGGVIEIFCLEPHEQYPDITSAMMQKGNVLWHCLVGGASKWKRGQVLEKKIRTGGGDFILRAQYREKNPGSFVIEMSWTPAGCSFAEMLHRAGAIPLPPYLKRNAEESDKTRYQTVYAEKEGSVAAPTAGLHFTERVLESLRAKQIGMEYLTLHVGAGTFKPVKSETMQEHEMHAEWIDVPRSAIEHLLEHTNKPVIAVGTTSLRTLESLYWLGVKSREAGLPAVASAKAGGGRRESGTLGQWEAYDLAKKNIPVKEALQSLLEWMRKNKQERLISKTQILIAPGYPFKIVNGLITNFHQPQSTLLLLVAALIGGDWKKVYTHALVNGYRFLSYGDGSLLWRKIDPVSSQSFFAGKAGKR